MRMMEKKVEDEKEKEEKGMSVMVIKICLYLLQVLVKMIYEENLCEDDGSD